MNTTTKKVEQRIVIGFKKFSKILAYSKDKDINESDTIPIIRGMLNEIFGYDLFMDITGEYAIRSTYCDLAIQIDNELKYLIEVKAVGIDLKENHLRQAADYAANKGIDWAILTNGVIWRVFKIKFEKPINYEEIFQIDFLCENPKDKNTIEKIYVLSKEAIAKSGKSVIDEFSEKSQLTSKYAIAAFLQMEGVANLIRKEIRNITKGIKIEPKDITAIIKNDILKRDVIDSDQAKQTHDSLNKLIKKAKKNLKKSKVETTVLNKKIQIESDSSDEV